MPQSPGDSHLNGGQQAKQSICINLSMRPTIQKLAKSVMTTSSILTPLKDLQVAKHHIPAHGLTPNTSIQNKPLLLYRNAFKANTSASQIEEHLSKVGVVDPAWRYTVNPSSPSTHFCRNKNHSCSDLALTADVLDLPFPQHLPRSSRHLPRTSQTMFRP